MTALRPWLLGVALLAGGAAIAAEDAVDGLGLVRGPATAKIEDIAEITVPAGYVFTGKKGTVELMRDLGNLVDGREVGFLAPRSMFEKGGKEHWFVVFEFDPVGYVKDDEKNSLNGDALLASLREGNTRGNAERLKQGLPTLTLLGWSVPPHYEEKTHNLEWGLKLSTTTGGQSINYEVRILGRRGVMACTLVGDPEEFKRSLPAFRGLLANYGFTTGEKYSEFRQGDTIAKVGLTGLIGAGALAVAYKSGLLKYLWKFGVLIFAGAAASIRKVWNRFFGKQESVDS